MTHALIKTFTEHIYTRSDFAYRISLLRELFEFAFFGKHESSIGGESIEAFASDGKRSIADIAFLRTLPASFFDSFTAESFYTELEKLSQESRQMKTLSLTLPVIFTRDDIEAIGSWVREAIAPDLLIDVDIDSSLAVGCRVVWNNQRHDFSIDHYLTQQRPALYKRFTEYVTRPVAA